MVCHCRIKEQILVIQWVVSLWSACMGEGDQRQIAERENKLSQMQLYCSVLPMSVDICTSVCVRGPGDNLVFFFFFKCCLLFSWSFVLFCFVFETRFFHCPETHQIVSGLVDSGNPEIYLPAWHSPVL